jgi:hypothetical protein
MAIIRDSTMNLNQLGTRVRILTGISTPEISDENMSELVSMSMEWFEGQTGLTYTVDTTNAFDNAVIYYTCYIASIAANGMGIEQIRIGDVFVQYGDEEPFGKWLVMANQEILAEQALSIKTSTYNADPTLGNVDWKKNIDGSASTLNVRQKPRGM